MRVWMIGRTMALVFPVVVWGATVFADPPADRSGSAPADVDFDVIDGKPSETLDTILSRPLPRGSYSETRRCVSKTKYRRITVIDPTLVALVGGPVDDYVWVSFLLKPCRGLRSDQVIHLRGIKPTICAGDSFAGLSRSVSADPRDMFQVSQNCGFGMMHRVERTRMDALLYAIAAHKRTRTIIDTRKAME